MRKILYITSCFSFLTLSYSAYAVTCTLDTQPSPAIASYEKNIDTILQAISREWGQASCADSSMSAGNTKRVLDIMQGSDYDIWNFFRSSPFFLDTSDKMLLPSAKKHDDSIQSIQQKILETGAEIGGKCAGDIIRFREDVPVENSRYKTKNRTLQEVLNDVYSQSGEVLSFYRDLASNVRNNEYLDESKFTIAPEGFSDDMREFYSPENIQQCHDEDAKKQKIQETQKKGLAEALKYPQAVDVWKKAFQFLLYGRSAQPDTPEEANPTTTAQAQEGGLWNSVALHNKLFQKIFWFFGNMQWGAAERVREAGKQNAQDKLLVPTTFSQVAELVKINGGNASPSSIQKELERTQEFAGYVQRSITEQETATVEKIAPNYEQNYTITTPAIWAIEKYSETLENEKNIFDKLCREAYEKRQATNFPGKDTCDAILEGSEEEMAA
jgi:hypothetical protein